VDDQFNKDGLAYSNAAQEVAKSLGLPFIDLWHAFLEFRGPGEGDAVPARLEQTNENLDYLLSDGVHFSGKGYRIWYDLLLDAIRRGFPELRTENLPTILPHIFDLDNADLPATLWKDVKVAKQ
jgi:lysophospholipase L1-like esterase